MFTELRKDLYGNLPPSIVAPVFYTRPIAVPVERIISIVPTNEIDGAWREHGAKVIMKIEGDGEVYLTEQLRQIMDMINLGI